VSGNISGVPNGTFVSRVTPSSATAGTAYVSFDGHRSGHFEPYAFRTTDFGKTWTKVTSGLPVGRRGRTIYEYPGQPAVAFIGTERALYITTDTAKTWTKFKSNLPTMPTYDILVQPRTKDLILGTHGRSIWILDDASPIANWSSSIASKPAHLFAPRPTTQHLFWEDFSNWAQGEYAGPNPPDGALISYSLSRPAQSVTLTITNSTGRKVRTLTGPGDAGVIHRVNWDLRHEVLTAQDSRCRPWQLLRADEADVAVVAAGVVEAEAGEGEVTKVLWLVDVVIRIPIPFPEGWGRVGRSYRRARTR
jgi:hypothetical protein